MIKYFTHYWANTTWNDMVSIIEQHLDGKLLRAGSNLFNPIKINKGDKVYIVTVIQGQLYLGGRIIVDHILPHITAINFQDWGYPLWEANYHIIMNKESAGYFKPDNKIPNEVTKNLKFRSSGGLKKLKYENEGILDRQTLRNVRQLTKISAERLDQFL